MNAVDRLTLLPPSYGPAAEPPRRLPPVIEVGAVRERPGIQGGGRGWWVEEQDLLPAGEDRPYGRGSGRRNAPLRGAIGFLAQRIAQEVITPGMTIEPHAAAAAAYRQADSSRPLFASPGSAFDLVV